MRNNLYTGHTITAELAELPVSLADARSHLRLDDLRHDDNYVIGLIKAECDWVERTYDTALLTKTILETHSAFPCNNEKAALCIAPVVSVTSVQYLDESGTLQTWANTEYDVRTNTRGTYIVPKPTKDYPGTYVREDAVRITYQAGFGAVARAIPESVKFGLLARIGRAYMEREDAPEFKTSMSDVLLHVLKRY